jgi:hypothetical protein
VQYTAHNLAGVACVVISVLHVLERLGRKLDSVMRWCCQGQENGQVKGSGPGKSTSAEMRTVTHGCVQERICLGHGKGTMYARAETQHSLPPEEEDSSDKISLGAASSVGESTSSYVRPRQSSICHQARRRQCLHDLHGQDRILIRISRLMKP